LYLERETSLLSKTLRVLHVAPEQAFYQRFKNFSHWEYTTTDLHSPLADVKADLTALPFAEETFDLIFCNHVLEHIPEDQKALSELYRVLKKGGTAILQVPLDENRKTTFEDNSITDPKERTRIFGQYDHVRIYGQDYYQRLETAGFQAEAVDLYAKISSEEINRFSLQQERIPVGVKSY
jgi:ubiquinone/menaquinone biosynthesis C-methylase UbiE